MLIGKRLRELRIAKGISRLEPERRSGLISISRSEGTYEADLHTQKGHLAPFRSPAIAFPRHGHNIGQAHDGHQGALIRAVSVNHQHCRSAAHTFVTIRAKSDRRFLSEGAIRRLPPKMRSERP